MSSSDVSFESPTPFPWESAEPTVRLVPSNQPTPESEFQSAVDYFVPAQPCPVEVLTFSDSDSVPSRAGQEMNNNCAGQEKNDECAEEVIPSKDPVLQSDAADELPATHSSLVHSRPQIARAATETVKASHTTDCALPVTAKQAHSVNAQVKTNKHTGTHLSSVMEARPPTSWKQRDAVDEQSTISDLSIRGFFNSYPCPPPPSRGRSASSSGSSDSDFTSDSERFANSSQTEETSVDGHPAAAQAPSVQPTTASDCAPTNAMEFGSLEDWSRDPSEDVPTYHRKTEAGAQRTSKGLFKRVRKLFKRIAGRA